MNRKTFIQKSLGAMLVGIPILSIAACSSDSTDGPNNIPDPDPSGESDCLQSGAVAGSISGNHGHTLTVSSQDVQSGTARTYSIQGSSGHNHDIMISANDFTSLQNNQSIEVTSTTDDGHTHAVVVTCA